MPTDPNISLAVQTPLVENPLDQAGKAMSLANMRQQQQGGALDLQQKQTQIDQTKALNDAYRGGMSIGQDGMPTVDRQKVIQGITAAGHGSLAPGLMKSWTDLDKSTGELSELRSKVASAESDYAGGVGAVVRQSGYDPNVFLAKAKLAVDGKAVDPNTVAPLIQHVQQLLQSDPTGEQAKQVVQQIADQFIAQSPAQQKLLNEGKTAGASESRAVSAAKQADTSAAEFAAKQPGIIAQSRSQAMQASAQTLVAVKDQAGYDAWRQQNPEIAKQLPPTWNAASIPVMGQRLGLTPAQQVTSDQAAANAKEAARHNLSTESTARLNTAIAGGRLAQEKIINGMKYGPDTQEFWVKQLQDNPDSIKEMPPEFRSVVGQKFRAATGLPLPTPLTGATQAQETAARNALDGISFIQNALTNPEIRKQIGPIMGRLGNAEQHVGTAVGLSPEAEALAQELRTRMRYFVFQEGKAVLGGRLPQKLMDELSSSSANVHMDAGMLAGSLHGAQGNAQSVMDNADKWRFGGKMRPREMRSAPEANLTPTTGGHVIEVNGKHYQYKGTGPTDDMNNYAEVKQ